MEKSNQKLQESKEQDNKIQTVRVSPKTRNMLTEILEKVNDKERGRSVKADEAIALAISRITQKEIKELQDAALSNADRLELGYQKYIREHTFIDKDTYLGLVLGGHLAGGRQDE